MRAKARYDVIEMVEVNFWTVAGQISQAWSPYFVLTQEAFFEYFEHLDDQGYLSYTVFARDVSPVAGYKGRRIRSLIAGMKMAGINNIEKCIVIVCQPYLYGYRSMVMAKKSPFTREELKNIRELVAIRDPRSEMLFPDISDVTSKYYIKKLNAMIGETVPIAGLFSTMRATNFGSLPINDDRPYLSGSGLLSNSRKDEAFVGDLYRILLKVMGVLALVFVGLPFFIKRTRGGETLRIDPRLLLILIFTGVGFMFIEMGAIYKYQLYLNHPTMAMIVVLSSMILGAGLGSIHSGTIPAINRERWIGLYSLVAVLATALILVVMPIYAHKLMLLLPLPALSFIVFIAFCAIGFVLGHIVPLSISVYAGDQPVATLVLGHHRHRFCDRYGRGIDSFTGLWDVSGYFAGNVILQRRLIDGICWNDEAAIAFETTQATPIKKVSSTGF